MLKRGLLLLSLLSGPAFAQAPSPAQLGLVVATPNVVQVLDSTKTWSTLGTINTTTHAFTPVSGIVDAPNDGTLYGRKSAAWSHLTHNDITDWAASVPPPTPPGGSSGQIQFNSGGSAFGGFTASGDVTINTATGAVAVTKTGGTAFGALATVTPGTGVATALGTNTNASGGVALVNGSPVVGNLLKWSATGVQDAGQGGATSVQRFTALASLGSAVAPVCATNGCTAGGTGYGTSVSGTLTLTTNGGKFVCSTYPVLNASSAAGGNITGTPTVNAAGSCTTMGGTADEVWTAGGSLTAGSGALFPLTWTATNQTYTPTTGTKYAMVYDYGAGGQGGGGASTVSTTASSGGGAGGGSSLLICLLSAAQISVSQNVSVGLGGRNGGNPSAIATGAGATGQTGGNSTFGALCKGWAGGGGFGGINAATIAGGGAGGGVFSAGATGNSGSNGTNLSGGGGGGTTTGVSPTAYGGGSGGGPSSAAGVGSGGGTQTMAGGTGGGAGGGLTTTPATSVSGAGGPTGANGFAIPQGNGGAANTSGQPGNNPANSDPTNECGGGGGGGGAGLTTTVAGNGGASALCGGGGGGGSVVNGAGSAPGFGGIGGDGVVDVVEFH